MKENVQEFTNAVNRMRVLSIKQDSAEINEAQKKLLRQLEIAERTQERMQKLSTEDNETFTEFIKES